MPDLATASWQWQPPADHGIVSDSICPSPDHLSCPYGLCREPWQGGHPLQHHVAVNILLPLLCNALQKAVPPLLSPAPEMTSQYGQEATRQPAPATTSQHVPEKASQPGPETMRQPAAEKTSRSACPDTMTKV